MKTTLQIVLLTVALCAQANNQNNLNKLGAPNESIRDMDLQKLLVSAGAGQTQELLKQLGSPKTYDSALFLLSSITSPEADKALHSALAQTNGRAQAGILNVLAARKYAGAVADAEKLIGSSDPVQSAAMSYLARTGTKEACDALMKASSAGECPATLADACLAAAECNPSEALAIYKTIYSAKNPPHIQIAALTGLAAVDKENRTKWLNEGLQSKRADWRGAMAKQVAELPDEDLQKFLKAIGSDASKASDKMVMCALTDNNRVAGLEYIRRVFEGPSTLESRRTALDAICAMGEISDVNTVIKELDKAGAETAEAVEQSLIKTKNPNVNSAVMKAFSSKKESDLAYKPIVNIIANRNIPGAAAQLTMALSAKDGQIRTTALLALRDQAEAKQLNKIFNTLNTAKDPAEAKAAQKALFTLSKKYPDESTVVIGSIYEKSSAKNKVILMQAVGIAGDNEGLKLIGAALKEKNEEVSDNALRTLASWKTTAALAPLAAQCKEYPKESLRTLALRSYITLCDKVEDPYEKLTALNVIKPLNMRPQEQKLLAAAIEPVATAKKMPAFKIKKIGSFRSEACGVADFNGDGKLDIVAGPYIYYAPEWKAFQFCKIGEKRVDDAGKGYYDDFFNLILDINKDGRPDVLTGCWFTQENQWYENPGSDKTMWKRHLIEKLGNHETGKLEDIDGDGKALEFLPHTHITCWYEIGKTPDGKPTMIRHTISEKRNVLGAGAGDINGDGRPDIIRPDVWFEAPEDIRKGKWKAHPIELAKINGKVDHTSNIIVFDLNKDGLNDLLTTTAHKHGIFWYEQKRGADKSISWIQHVIDESWSQAHYLAFADIDNDGNKEIITGKRFMAHNGGDPDAYGKLCIYYYRFTPGPNPVFTKHAITVDEGVSAGLNIEAVDMDGDGDLDLVTTGKFGGPILLENQLK